MDFLSQTQLTKKILYSLVISWFIIIFFPTLAFAAISVDGLASVDGGDSTSFTFSHTIGSGEERLLVVGVALADNATDKVVASVTYDNTNMVEVASVAGTQMRIQVFQLVAPTVGTADVVVTTAGGQSNKVGIGALSFFGVDQTTPIDTGTIITASGENEVPSISVTSESGDLVMDILGTDVILPDVGSGQTERWNSPIESGKESGASSEIGASSVTMSWANVSGKFTHVGFNINSAPDITAPTVSALSPVDDATDASPTANLSITFDENVVASASGNIIIKKTSDDSTVETISADDAKVTVLDEVVTVNPSVTLLDLTEYYVLIDAGAFEDVSGNNYAGISSATAWSFTTDDTVVPTTPGIPRATISTEATAQEWSWTASTDAGSGVKHYLWRVGNGSSGTSTSPTVTTNLEEGNHTFYVKAEDNAGNQSSESSSVLAVLTSSVNNISVDCGVPLTQVVVVDGVLNPKLDLSSIVVPEEDLLVANLDCEIVIKTLLSSASVTVTIPSGTTVKGLSTLWDEAIIPPITTTPDSSLLPANSEVALAIQIGDDDALLEITKGTRILVEGQAGKKAGHISSNEFSEITRICSDDSQTSGDALAENTSCKIDSGSDLVIWTKHFSEFVSYTVTTVSEDASSNGGGGGGGWTPPAPSAPEGGFKFFITPDVTISGIITLNFSGGPDAKKVAVSDNIGFSPATYSNYKTSTAWTLSGAFGEKTLYAKFSNQYGRYSKVLSDSVIYKSSGMLQEKEDTLEVEKKEVAIYRSIPSGFLFKKHLIFGMNNTEVYYLQIILKEEIGPPLYPENTPASGWFGPITIFSLRAFQDKYHEDILSPEGFTKSTGYVGNSTIGKLNELLNRREVPEKEMIEIPSILSIYTFERSMRYNDSLEDIKHLQIFLNLDTQTRLAENGAGSPGQETIYFGPLTRGAVIRFQEKYAKDILTPWELTEGTGFVGKTTTTKINELLEQSSSP